MSTISCLVIRSTCASFTVNPRNFSQSGVQEKVPDGSTFIFVHTWISWKHTVGVVERNLCQNQLDPESTSIENDHQVVVAGGPNVHATGWWRSRMVGIFSDCSTREIINRTPTCDRQADRHGAIVSKLTRASITSLGVTKCETRCKASLSVTHPLIFFAAFSQNSLASC